MGERYVRNVQVRGSIPLISTISVIFAAWGAFLRAVVLIFRDPGRIRAPLT